MIKNSRVFSEDDRFITSMERQELSRIKMVLESRNKDGMKRAVAYGHSLWDELGIGEVEAC